jgi:hypothetical protein
VKRRRICRLQLNQLLVGHNVRARLKCGAHGLVFHGRPLAVLHQLSTALFFYTTYHRGLSYATCL